MTKDLCTISIIPFDHVALINEGNHNGIYESFQLENVLLENQFAEHSQELDSLRGVLQRLKNIANNGRPEMRGAARRVAREVINYARSVSLDTDSCVCVVISGRLFFDQETMQEFALTVPPYVRSLQTEEGAEESIIAYGANYSERNDVLAFMAAHDRPGWTKSY